MEIIPRTSIYWLKAHIFCTIRLLADRTASEGREATPNYSRKHRSASNKIRGSGHTPRPKSRNIRRFQQNGQARQHNRTLSRPFNRNTTALPIISGPADLNRNMANLRMPNTHLLTRLASTVAAPRSPFSPAASPPIVTHLPPLATTQLRFDLKKNLAAGSQSHPKMAPCVHSLKHEHKPPAKAIKHTRSKTPLLALRSARTATLIGPGVSLIASEQKRNQTSRHQLMQPQNLLTSAHAIRSVWHKDGWPFCARNPITSFHCSSQRPHGRQQWTAFLLP